MKESWTDERLDDLNGRGEEGFRRVDADLRDLRSETKTEFTALRSETKTEFTALRSDMNARFEAMQSRLEALQRLLLQIGGGMLAALCAALIGLIATQI